MEPLDLRGEGLCKNEDSEKFFPPGEQHLKPRDSEVIYIEDAKIVCRKCPVREECLTYALDTRQEWGIWGGLTSAERKVITRRRDKKIGSSVVQIAEAV